jgi:L-rhamnose mutarotase
MAKFELRFIDCFNKNEFIKTECNLLNSQSVIEIYGKCGYDNFSIYLDKSTAIKFAKTLRTEINKFKESEVNNG